MRKSWKMWLGTAALLAALPLGAQQTAKEAEQHAAPPQEYDKILKPAAENEILGRFVGKWNANLSVLVYGSPPREVTMKDTFDARWILNDRFVEADYSYDLVGAGVSNGKIIMGYNGATKEFFRNFLIDWDSRGTFSDGVYIRSKNALVFRGEENDPITGDSFEKREVFTFGPDKDKFYYEQFYRFADGSELRVMWGDYIRVKETKGTTKQ